MKLLVIIPSTKRGGVEEYSLKIAASAAGAGWEVAMAFPRTDGTSSLIDDVNRIGLVYYQLNVAEIEIPTLAEISKQHQALIPILKDLIIPRIQFDLRIIPHLWRTRSLLRKLKPDAVMIVLPWPDFGLGSMLACGSWNVPTMVVFQLFPRALAIGKIKRKLYDWIRKKNQKWMGVSQSNCRCISQSFAVPEMEVTCIYNGVSIKAGPVQDVASVRAQLRRELGLHEQAKIALTVARLDTQKGHDFLIPAIPHIVKAFPELKFVWVGEGAQKTRLLELLADYNMTEQVLFPGYRPDIPRLLQASDLFIFPTYFEGQPFALLEAMAYGLPVISTATDGIPEVIEHGVHGLLTRKGDSCDLQETVLWALRNPGKMQAMAANAKERIQDFSEENMVAQTLAVLSGLLK